MIAALGKQVEIEQEGNRLCIRLDCDRAEQAAEMALAFVAQIAKGTLNFSITHAQDGDTLSVEDPEQSILVMMQALAEQAALITGLRKMVATEKSDRYLAEAQLIEMRKAARGASAAIAGDDVLGAVQILERAIKAQKMVVQRASVILSLAFVANAFVLRTALLTGPPDEDERKALAKMMAEMLAHSEEWHRVDPPMPSGAEGDAEAPVPPTATMQ